MKRPQNPLLASIYEEAMGFVDDDNVEIAMDPERLYFGDGVAIIIYLLQSIEPERAEVIMGHLEARYDRYNL